ncbi:MAG: hypothetical protein GVY06_03400 [Alphaproteobacteria bacterium]|nr:hypothetical protein [Alphaproteobacteria bacterium]
MTTREVAPDAALNAFLEAVRDAAAEDPAFKARLIDALGFTVLYEGEEQFEGANPVSQAERWSPDAFKRIWNAARVPQIREALKNQELATTSDMRGLRKAELIDLMYRRAEQKARNDGRI